MARFMLIHTQTYTPTRLVLFVGAPFAVRAGLLGAAFALYRLNNSVFMSWFSLIIGELISSTFDTVLFEYAHVVANNKDVGRVSWSMYFAALNHPRHLSMIALINCGAIIACVGFYANRPASGFDGFGYLQSFGTMINVGAAYAHRETALQLIEQWLLSPQLQPSSLTRSVMRKDSLTVTNKLRSTDYRTSAYVARTSRMSSASGP